MSVFNKILGRSVLAISIVFVLLTACGGGSASTDVAADFSAYGVKGTINGQNITIDLSGQANCSTTVENMVIGINANGASISPDPRVARDYSQPVQFTLTAPDGTKVVYTVSVKGAECVTAKPVEPCTAAPVGSTGYSLVFKGCSTANVAEYYDKTECVRDNATGLIWQGQTPAGTGLRANDQLKTNFDSTTALQKWKGTFTGPGGTVSKTLDFVAPTTAEINAITNSVGYKNAVNNTNLCGSSAWRLPIKDELLSIVNTTGYPIFDNTWFPNTVEWLYWTSTPYLEHTFLVAWYVRFDFGYAGYAGYGLGYGDSYHTRLVH